jgi:hypothetical protein
MTGHHHARRGVLRLLVGFALASAVAISGVGPVGPAGAADQYQRDVARRADFVPQTNFVQCVGASLQMMINMIEPGRDRSASEQLRLQKLARKLSPPRRDGSIRQGASVRGWVKVLHREVDQPYRLVGTDTLNQAVKLAARAIEQTGAPVGLLVWRGRHAWVMSGFEATKDLGDGGKVTSVTIYDPLYPFGDDFWGPSPRPGVPISVRALGRQFVPRRTNSNTNNNQFTTTLQQAYPTLSGKYVLVLPYVPHAPVRRPA